MRWLEEIFKHAEEEAAGPNPKEACGLIVAHSNGEERLIRARNVALNPRTEFSIAKEAWLGWDANEGLVGVYHSHVMTSAAPSPADLSMCEATGVTWHIVSLPSRGYRCVQPSGYRAPYLKRDYVYGVHDCYSIMRDFYAWDLGIQLDDFDRPPLAEVPRMYMDNFERQGFVRLIDQEPQRGDVFLIQIAATQPNHVAVYMGDGMILHHAMKQLSAIVPFAGGWRERTTHHWRHKKMMEAGHG